MKDESFMKELKRRCKEKAREMVLPFVVMSILCFIIFGLPIITAPLWKPINDQINTEMNLKQSQSDLIRTTQDCFVLKQEQLQLISEGANSDAWFPGDDDSMLKMAKEKYAVLGCLK